LIAAIVAAESVCAPLAGSGIKPSTMPSFSMSLAASFRALAAFSASVALRQRIAAAPSGEMTE